MERRIKVYGEKSDWYKEAIFTLKEPKSSEKLPHNLVEYAEQLIETHMKKGMLKVYEGTQKKTYPPRKTVKKWDWIDTLFWGSIILFLIVCVLYISL